MCHECLHVYEQLDMRMISYHQLFMTSLFALPRIDPGFWEKGFKSSISAGQFQVSFQPFFRSHLASVPDMRLNISIWKLDLSMHPFKDFPVCGLLKRLARNPYMHVSWKAPLWNGVFFDPQVSWLARLILPGANKAWHLRHWFVIDAHH